MSWKYIFTEPKTNKLNLHRLNSYDPFEIEYERQKRLEWFRKNAHLLAA